MKGQKEVLRFHYQTLHLCNLDARVFVEQGAVPAYGLLPVMAETSDELLLGAIESMLEYYQDNEDLLRDELLCFKVLLQRAQRLPEVQLEHVLRRIRMFDPLLEEDPWVKEKVAEGMAKGEAKGALKEARDLLVRFVRRHYPALIDLAQTRAMQGEQSGALNALIEQLWGVSDEQAARALLEQYSAS